ncbi:MAG: thiamine diphosphokinase [Bacteroidales bacterium]|nr:thiamine diphosphokinase [Bacteroidales bacterium]
MEKRKHIVILAAGDFPTHPVPLAALREADFVVCCDSAYEGMKNEESRMKNLVVIGDGDSLSAADKQTLGDRWIHVAEQDYNDLHKAMAWVMDEVGGMRYEVSTSDLRPPTSNLKITILGATGRREDHTLGNLSYLATFADEYPGIDLEMLTDHGRFITFCGTQTFPSFPRQQVSLVVFNPAVGITSEGLRWPLHDFHPSLWWQATLNEALTDRFTLSANGPVLLFRTYDPKP